MKTKITYIHHSSFSVETDDFTLLFDYYKGTLPAFHPDKPVYVFASHKHHDHFDLSIFNLSGLYPCVTYILSSDIRMNTAYMERKQVPVKARDHIIYMKKNAFLTLEEDTPSSLIIETLASNDAGVAFIIQYGTLRIYHGGDLNWWSWREETDTVNDELTGLFIREMHKIEGQFFDIAFLPLDPRQEDRFSWGFDYFMRSTETRFAFPMHFWEDYSVIPLLKSAPVSMPYRDKIIEIKEAGQEFLLQ